MKLMWLVLSVLCVPGWARAREEEEEKSSPPRQIRLLALGDHPPFRQEIRGGVRYELPPPAGSLPPREVLVGAGDKTAGTTRLTLGRISGGLTVPGGAGPLVLRKTGEPADAKPWLSLTRPESGDFIVLLWRDPAANTWEMARSLVLSDGAPAGSVTIANVAPGPVAAALGGKKFVLHPGKPVRKLLATGKPVAFQLAVPGRTGRAKRTLSRSLEQEAGERTVVLVYRSDAQSPRSPVGVTVHRERAPSP